MILDRLDNADRYAALHPGFARGFRVPPQVNDGSASPGRHELDGQRLFVMVADEQGKGRAAAKLEVHRRYIDIQMIVPSAVNRCDGRTNIGELNRSAGVHLETVRSRSRTSTNRGTFNSSSIGRKPGSRCPVECLQFSIPEDAHAPLAGEGPVTKAIVKVAVNW